jgi:hypothetical protein
LNDASCALRSRATAISQIVPATYNGLSLRRRSDGSDEHGEGEYALEYADKSARVVMVTSEPITGTTSDWVVVPRNHALIVTRDAAGWMNVLHTPLYSGPPGPRLEIVLNCLKSIPLDNQRSARLLEGAALRPFGSAHGTASDQVFSAVELDI